MGTIKAMPPRAAIPQIAVTVPQAPLLQGCLVPEEIRITATIAEGIAAAQEMRRARPGEQLLVLVPLGALFAEDAR